MDYPGYEVVKDGVFVPSGMVSNLDVVYDSEYGVVTESCVLRGNNKSEIFSSPPEFLADKIIQKIEKVDRRLLFMGQFMWGHYGHLVTEGISRYWYLMQNPEKKWCIPTSENPFGIKEVIKCYLKPGVSHRKKFMQVFGIGHADILVVDKPVQATEIIVPHPSMYNRYEIYPSHLAVTRKLGREIVRSSTIRHDTRPVYLSRTKLNRKTRAHTGEDRVESYCKEQGYKIVYPEQLSLKEQIILFNSHDIFVGCLGSAFHTIMFRFVDRKATNIYMATEGANSNYDMVDNLMGSTSRYIACIFPVSESSKTLELNYQKAIEGLDEISISI